VTTPDDKDLKSAFRALREHDRGSARAPDFAAMLQEAKRQASARPQLDVVAGGGRRRRLFWLGGWASAAVAAGVAALVLLGRGPSGEDDFARLVAAYTTEAAAGEWSSPTAGLLDVPGMDLMRSVPSIGSPLRGLDPSSLPPRPSSPQEERS
jgi:hypothetical protein